MRGRLAAVIPVPMSLTESKRHSREPVWPFRSRVGICVEMVSVPVPAIASTAFVTRLMTTFQLHRVEENLGSLRSAVHHDSDMVAGQRPNDDAQFVEKIIQNERLGIKGALAAEREKVLGNAPSVSRGFMNGFQMSVDRGAGRDLAFCQVDLEKNYAEHVAKFMCDAPGQASHGVHFLRVADLGF